MSTFKNKNSLRTIEARIVQKLKNNEAQPKFTGSYKKKRVVCSATFIVEIIDSSTIYTDCWAKGAKLEKMIILKNTLE